MNFLKAWKNGFDEEWKAENGELTYRGDYVCNFIPCVKSVRQERYLDRNGSPTIEIISILIYIKQQCLPFKVSIDRLKRVDFQEDVDIRCYVSEDKRRLLIDFILRQIAQVATEQIQEVYILEKLGFAHLPDGKIVYNTGSRILGEARAKVVSCETLRKYRLAVDYEMDQMQLERKIKEMLHLCVDNSVVLFSYFILALLRDLFQKAGVPIRFCMYLLGENQSFKTTLATNYCSLYNRDEDIEHWLHNLTATEARLLEILDTEKDCVSIIDDLNHSDSRSQERQQEAKISTLIRSAANNVGKETKNKQLEINAQVLLCGEYPLENVSTNNRLIILLFERGMIDRAKLREIQRHPLVISTFAERFICWILENYDVICREIRTYYLEFLDNRASEDGYQDRLNCSAGILGTAYRMFLLFCEKYGWNMELDMRQFNVALENVLDKQIECLHLEEKQETDYIAYMFEAYRTEDMFGHVTTKRPVSSWEEQKIFHDEERNLVYICNFKWEQMIKDYIPISVKLTAVNQKFVENEILCVDNTRARTKKLAHQRCYVLNYAAWEDYIKDIVFAQQLEENP